MIKPDLFTKDIDGNYHKHETSLLTCEILISAAQACLSPDQYEHFEALLENDLEAHNRLVQAINNRM